MRNTMRRMAALMMAVMMVFLSSRIPARAVETYTITLYGNGGYCIDDTGSKQDTLALDVSAGTVLTMSESCGDVSWQNADPHMSLIGWADSDNIVYDVSSSYTVTQDAELYAVWDSLVNETALAAAIAAEPETAESEPEITESGLEAVETESSVADSESATIESEPEIAESGPEAVETESSVVDSEPEAIESETGAAESESVAVASAPVTLAAASPNQKIITVTIDGGNGGYYIDANGAQQTSLVLQHTIELDENGAPIGMGLELELTSRIGGVEWLNSDPHNRLSAWNISGTVFNFEDHGFYTAEEDETITAEWEACNLITFDSGSTTAYFEYNNETPSAVTVKYEVNDTLGYNVGEPVNTDSTKIFAGWDTNGDGERDTSDYYGYEPTGDTTITAVWADKIVITFDPQGGSYYGPNGLETAPYVYEGSSADWYKLDSVKPYLHHSTSALVGWAYDKAGASMVSDDEPYADVNNKTLYAVWAKDFYTLTYDANGGTFSGTVSGTLAYDRIPATETWPTAQVTTDGHENPERSGYEFGGWALDPDGKEQFRSVWGENSRTASMPETGDFTIYAIWKNPSEATDSTGLWIYQELGNGNAEIIDYLGTDSDVVIPDTVDGLTVTRLKLSEMGTGVHNNTVDITSLVIPDTVQSFSDMTGGMMGRTSLQSVTFGSRIREIPTNMFRDCTSLSQVVLPESLENIGAWAFQNTAVTSIDLPASCKELSWRVFYGCSSLEEVTIRGNLRYFGSEIFVETGLKTIRFMADLPEEGDATSPNAFYGITATAYYPAYWTSVPSSTYQEAVNITWVREATVPVMQIDHQAAAPDQVLVNGTALTPDQYVVTVTQDADGNDVVIIELTENFKSTLSDEVEIQAVYASETFDGTVYPQNISYATLDVENESQTVSRSSADGLKPVVITVSGQASELESVAVDGTVLKSSAYTVASGSTIITLLEDYLATLSEETEEHDVTVTFKDGGIATASFKIVSEAQETPEESSAEESEAEESRSEESKAEESEAEESAAEESKEEDSKPEESKAEESEAEESKAEESKADESKSEESSSVKPVPSDSTTPKTGDPGYLIWVVVIAASGVVLAFLLTFLLKKRKS